MLKLRRFLKPHLKETIIGSLLKLLEAFFELLLPFYMIKIMDIGIVTGDKRYILITALKMLLFAVLGLISVVICQKLAAIVSCNVATDIRKELMEKVSKLSYFQLDKIGTSSLVNRLTIDVNLVRDGVAFLIRLVTRAPFLCIGAITMGMMVDKKMSIIFIIIIPLFSFILFFISKKIIPIQKSAQKILDNFSSQLRENLSGVRVIRAFVRQDIQKKKVNRTINDLSQTYISLNNFKNLIGPITTLVLNLAIILILYRGGYRVDEGSLSRSQILGLIQYMSQIMFALIVISNLVTLFTQASASAQRIDEVLNLEVGMEYKKDGVNFTDRKKNSEKISFNNLSFAYVNEKYSLDKINFTIKKGETLGIIGPTGAGKTTLVNLLCRFYDPSKGEVLIDGHSTMDFKEGELLKKISIVPQKSVLFSGSIAENIAYGKQNATDEEIIDALKISQAYGFVKDLKDGIHSRVERGGVNFSGGQRQRLSIARGIIKKPEILILDDSLSALDYKTDRDLRKSLREFFSNTTVIIVSQRVSSVLSADNILVLEDGIVGGFGNHEYLLAAGGLYQEIYKTQQDLESGALDA